MRKDLPVRPNLDHLKAQAKDLLDAARRKEPDALRRFRDALPAAKRADDEHLGAMKLALHDAQSVVAREYGFASWAELRAHVERLLRAPAPELLRALVQRQMAAPPPSAVMEAIVSAAREHDSDELSIEAPLPLLPVRNALLAVGAVAPFSIGRATSIAAVQAARSGTNALGVFAQRDEAKEDPTDADLHPIGCAARLLSVVPGDRGATWIVVRAVRWIRLEAVDRTQPYLAARVAPFTITDGDSDEVKRLHRLLRERMRAVATNLPDPEYLVRMTEHMTALQLADAAVANLWCSVEDKARYASETSLVARLLYVLDLIDRAA